MIEEPEFFSGFFRLSFYPHYIFMTTSVHVNRVEVVKMKHTRLFLICALILPWLTLPLLGKSAFKKYLPATILISIVTKWLNIYGKKRRWWAFFESFPKKTSGEDLWIIGPYFFTSLWVLKKTAHSFPLFIAVNLCIHLFFTYTFDPLLRKLGIFSLVRLKRVQYIWMLMGRALLLYAFQFCIDRVKKPTVNETIR